MSDELLPWFAGLTVDHLFADCPSRARGEKTLRKWGWWDLRNSGPMGVDPDGTDVCGLCIVRHKRKATAEASGGVQGREGEA